MVKYSKNLEKMKKLVILFILGIFLLNLVSSTSIVLNPSSISETITVSGNKTIPVLYMIQNTDNSSVTFNVNLGGIQFITSSISNIPVGASSTATGSFNLNINIPSNTQINTYTGNIFVGSQQLPYTINVIQNIQSNPTDCGIDIFPLSLQNIKIKQGETKTRSIQLTNPQCYTSINIQGVVLSTDEKPITLGELNLGILQPGTSILIPLEIDSTGGVSTGSYSDILLFNIFNLSGSKINVPSVSISTTVTLGINPIDSGFSLTDLPTCSLSSIEMNLNNSYKMTCGNVNPNIQIRPLIDTNFIQGIGVQETSGQYIYEFKTKKIGISTIGSEFLYKNAPIGSLWEQEIRITQTGSNPVYGTNLSLSFNPSIESLVDKQNITINVIDSKTGNIVQNSVIYINGNPYNTNMGSYILTVDQETTYYLRATASGFSDYVFNFSISPELIIITAPDLVKVGEYFNITTNPENATIMIDDYLAVSPYSISYSGVHLIRASKEGFIVANKTITVEEPSFVLWTTPQEEVKLGKEYCIEFTINGSYNIKFQKDFTSNEEQLVNGTNNRVCYKLKKGGNYNIYLDGRLVKQLIMEQTEGFFSKYWFWIILIIIIGIGAGLFLFFRSRSESDDAGSGFEMSPKD